MARKKAKKVKRTSKKHPQKFYAKRLDQISNILLRLEKEVTQAVGSIRKKSEQSTHALRKNFDEIVKFLGATDIYEKASQTTDSIKKEISKVAEVIVSRVKNIDFNQPKAFFDDLKDSLIELRGSFQKRGIVKTARDKAMTTGKRVLQAFRGTANEGMNEISRKLVDLEKKIRNLGK